jgi:hypothetical protein
MRNVLLKMLIQTAYDLRGPDAGQRISGGPGWLDSNKYDVEAKAEDPVPEAELKRMLQSLLAGSHTAFALGAAPASAAFAEIDETVSGPTTLRANPPVGLRITTAGIAHPIPSFCR